MTSTWPDYLSVADGLLDMPQRTASLEAIARAAVSRAYYAVHRVAHDELTIRRNMPLPDIPGGVHMQVIQAFFTVKHRAWGRVGQDLATLPQIGQL